MLDLGPRKTEMIIVGKSHMNQNEVELFAPNGDRIRLTGDAVPVHVEEFKEEVVDQEAVLAEILRLKSELEALKGGGASTTVKKESSVKKEDEVKKNHRPGKADPNRKYTRLGKLELWGRVPQQQRDLAAIMEESMELGSEWTEEELFDLIATSAREYASLRNSKQDPTYLFRYYRGLKNDGKHAGFVARNFLRVK
jgi:hypothetical protein